jgi:hypothetical protein
MDSYLQIENKSRTKSRDAGCTPTARKVFIAGISLLDAGDARRGAA